MRPRVIFLNEKLIRQIVSSAMELLCELGLEIQNDDVLSMLSDHGAAVDMARHAVKLTPEIISKCLETSPSKVELFDVHGDLTHDLSGDNVYFTPGSSAISILDHSTGRMHKPSTQDYIRYTKLTCGLDNIAAQSTAFIPDDVHARISDSYRLFLSLLYGRKPVVTGAFTVEAFEVMKNMQLAVRGTRQALVDKPLTVFSCCPTSPLKWSDVTSQNVVDCATWGIPVEFIAMPMSGFIAPVTLVGTLVQHTAETLSGVVISQLTRPGAPMLYGGSPAVFDIRYETTPMGAVETMMLDCACSEIGKHFGIPTQAYISLSDSKLLDAQAGLETAMGATLAALSGINSISGPGMLDFESCVSLEKLVVDDEIAGMTTRLNAGIEPRDDFPVLPLFRELMEEQHLLISRHTRKHLRREHRFPGKVINRANRARWLDEGALTIGARANHEVNRLVEKWEPNGLDPDVSRQLNELMEAEAARYDMTGLPDRPADS